MQTLDANGQLRRSMSESELLSYRSRRKRLKRQCNLEEMARLSSSKPSRQWGRNTRHQTDGQVVDVEDPLLARESRRRFPERRRRESSRPKSLLSSHPLRRLRLLPFPLLHHHDPVLTLGITHANKGVKERRKSEASKQFCLKAVCEPIGISAIFTQNQMNPMAT